MDRTPVTPAFTITLPDLSQVFWVYVIRDQEEVLWVGQSRDLLTRLGHHTTHRETHGHHAWSRRPGLSVDLYPCTSREDMDAIEDYLLETLRPKYNILPAPRRQR